MALMNEREYADHRKALGLPGATQAAVNKAVHSGRITKVMDRTSQRLMIDAEIADAQWARNTDLDQQLRGLGGVLPAAPREEATAGAEVQTSALTPAPAPRALDADDAEALRTHAALEIGLISLPAILAREGIPSATVDRVLDALFDAMRGELAARQEPASFIDEQLDSLRSMVAEERADPGSWTK
jgi:hypothetical protein